MLPCALVLQAPMDRGTGGNPLATHTAREVTARVLPVLDERWQEGPRRAVVDW